ncbi:flavin reductase [Pseudomonas gessardii]|uniref:Flavin reductase n=1 Tax=Pseudomonas gessardii TaxID=78544 RepID=A0A7Y1QKL7_9PSED|nr:flavin reductase [Pseudomonas gessardii]MCF4978250.1 flavin reductase [Pseudomonas gessardii]MCF4991140.1 flavin reductase [Pseudomonas gessardii]MCF5084078.1 flavin reductase [Pseudomonas gessardii]MCF5095686.1 flavin reductase [Pseudomonas gessardii]MCF5108600.1 flavin reductase [Pseudomonas gessardii]
MVDTTGFRNAMALLGGAVSVIATDGAAGRFGFTASAVCSVTDQPPTLLVCMNRASTSNINFKSNGVLSVNVLTADHQAISGVFANREMNTEQRFACAQWLTLESGAPILQEALVSFDCRIAQAHEVGSHTIFYCEVLGICNGESQEGLVYFNRAYHRLGDASKAAS